MLISHRGRVTAIARKPTSINPAIILSVEVFLYRYVEYNMLLLLAKQHNLMQENFYHIMHTTIYPYLKAFSVIYKSSLSNKRSGKIKINLLDERKYNVLSIEEIPYKSIEPSNCFLHNEIKLKITC